MSQINDPNPNRAPWTDSASEPGGFGTAANPAPYDASDLGSQNLKGSKRGLGCWVWGCLAVIVLMLIAITGISVAAYFVYTAQVEKYTDAQPANLPVVEMKADELETLEKRIEAFTNQVRPKADSATNTEATAVEPGELDAAAAEKGNLSDEVVAEPPVRELVLTAEEINGLIASKPDMRGRIFVEIKNGAVSGQVSFPTDMFPGASGRFFNADAQFDVSMEDGVLVVRLTDASVKGERLPQQLLDGIAQENLAKDLYNDPENADMLRKFDSIQVVDESIVLRLKEPKDTAESELDSDTEPGPASESDVQSTTESASTGA